MLSVLRAPEVEVENADFPVGRARYDTIFVKLDRKYCAVVHLHAKGGETETGKCILH